jgi:hypothetical protein
MSSPEFKAALAKYGQLSELYGDDHQITKDAFTVLLKLAPDEYIEEAHKVAVEMNLMPEPNGYLEDGTAMYRLDDIATKVGVTIEDAELAMHNIKSVLSEAGLPNTEIVDSRVIHLRH